MLQLLQCHTFNCTPNVELDYILLKIFLFFCDRLESRHQEEKSFGEHVNPGAKNFYCVELEDIDDKDEKNKKAFKDNIRKMMMIKIVWIGQ